jgi:hypothetical protein
MMNDRALQLLRIERLTFANRGILLAHVIGLRELTPQEIKILEARIRKATGQRTLELAVSTFLKNLSNAQGMLRYGWIPGQQATPEIRERIREIRADLVAAFRGDERFTLVNVNATRLDDTLHFLLEIVGPEIYPRQKVEALQTRLARSYAEKIALYSWSRIEVVQGPEGPLSFARLQRSFSDRQKENLPEELPQLLEASGR